MKTNLSVKQLHYRIKGLTLFFIAALILSGLTALPIQTGLSYVVSIVNAVPLFSSELLSPLKDWLLTVNEGVINTNKLYPFMAYGTDWLAFAHIIIAIAFVGVYREPVRNVWIVYWAMTACVLVIPLAFICGYVRGIPLFWILIDCSFGIFGIIPLLFLRKYIRQIEALKALPLL